MDLVSTFPMLFSGYRNRNTVFWFYWLKVFRVYELTRVNAVVHRFINKMLIYKWCRKMTLNKFDFMITQLIKVSLIMHVLSCGWLKIGETYDDSWIKNVDGTISESSSDTTKYITSLYWVVTTLTTVGYGDVKGFTTQEYSYTLFVELVSVLFFSFVMGSINEIFMDNNKEADFSDAKLESVDVWLVKLDNSRMSK